MSAIILTIIGCDECGETYASGDMKQMTAKEQRDEYKVDGWKYSKGKDYCPECRGAER